MLNGTSSSLLEGAGVILSIFLIVYLIRRGWDMYWVLLLAIAALALTNGDGLIDNILLFYHSLTSYTAFYLGAMVVCISLFGHLHQKIGAMQKMVESLQLLIRDPRILLMIFPGAIAYFLTVPGAAIISAPIVEETGRKINMPPLEMAMSNIIYRHLVTLVNPFNTGVILASAITGFSIGSYLGFTAPIVVVVFIIATAIFFFRYPRPKEEKPVTISREKSSRAIRSLLITVLPYAVAIFLGLACGIFFPVALLFGIAVCFFIEMPRTGLINVLKERFVILMHGFNWVLIISTILIVVYKDFMLEAESFLQVVEYLVEMGMPLLVLLVILPLFTGFITGNTAAALGISLPILIPFLSSEMLTIRYFGIAYLSAFAGYFGSPVHMCTYLTNEYFKTPLYSLIKRVNVYGAILLAVGLLIAFVL
ncbi:MAG: hypothetical protein AVO34_10360 [Firmicutes bacterium ML8_F2]|jgi:uncharacterized protein|nr:MAG: hypothetical protein AVO34_10360 [Firmicutes bacterium ML8_F2]